MLTYTDYCLYLPSTSKRKIKFLFIFLAILSGPYFSVCHATISSVSYVNTYIATARVCLWLPCRQQIVFICCYNSICGIVVQMVHCPMKWHEIYASLSFVWRHIVSATVISLLSYFSVPVSVSLQCKNRSRL